MKFPFSAAFLIALSLNGPARAQAPAGKKSIPTLTRTGQGMVNGVYNPSTGIISFKGIPFAQPPVGDLRWKDPQPPRPWKGTLQADQFGPRAMQSNLFGDMVFRSNGMSEDCLYLNVWTPTLKPGKKLPVLVYFYGGGFVAGDGSEGRYDGESLARFGMVTLTVNYRLGIFGFFSYPGLSRESPHQSSGNYGLMDQNAALRWVQQNIAAFGGDPARITIAGESAGSISVSAQMASPLSRNLISGAIGESGAMIAPTLPAIPLKEAEQKGVTFARRFHVNSLDSLRALPATQLLADASQGGAFQTTAVVDGYFLPEPVIDIFKEGKQAHVPLLVGWNSAEIPYMALIQGQITPANYAARLKNIFPQQADEALKLYPGSSQQEIIQSATALASDRFIAYSTWKWAQLQHQTGQMPVYVYHYSHPRPAKAGEANQQQEQGPGSMPPPLKGASHSSEIEYALGNLGYNKVYAWTAEDFKVSRTIEGYFANFILRGNPNGQGLPVWNPLGKGGLDEFMDIDVDSHAVREPHRDRYLFLDRIYNP